MAIGGTPVENLSDFGKVDYFIASDDNASFIRTVKSIAAFGCAKKMVTARWMVDSINNGGGVSSANYRVLDNTTHAKYGFFISKTLANAKSNRPNGLLSGKHVYIYPRGVAGESNHAPSLQELKDLVVLFGGSLLGSQEKLSTVHDASNILILGKIGQSLTTKMDAFVQKGARLFTWPDLLDIFTRQSLDLVPSATSKPKPLKSKSNPLESTKPSSIASPPVLNAKPPKSKSKPSESTKPSSIASPPVPKTKPPKSNSKPLESTKPSSIATPSAPKTKLPKSKSKSSESFKQSPMKKALSRLNSSTNTKQSAAAHKVLRRFGFNGDFIPSAEMPAPIKSDDEVPAELASSTKTADETNYNKSHRCKKNDGDRNEDGKLYNEHALLICTIISNLTKDLGTT